MRSDEELVRAIRGGDARAFDELYARYARRLFGYVHRMLGRRDLAEDVFQEVFLEVLEKDSLELRDDRFAGWLFTVARNRCLTLLRTSERREQMLRGPAAAEALGEAPAAVAGGSSDELVERRAKLELLREALATLSESAREVLLLKEVGGLTYRQIAELQEVPEGTAKSRLHFALRAVRRALGVKRSG